MNSLRVLNIGKTKITDESAETLIGMPWLDTLVVIDTKVTDEGVRKLLERLPNLR